MIIRKWETSSDAVPAATYSQCRGLDVLKGEGARFSGDGVSALSGDSPDYLMEAVPPPCARSKSGSRCSVCNCCPLRCAQTVAVPLTELEQNQDKLLPNLQARHIWLRVARAWLGP